MCRVLFLPLPVPLPAPEFLFLIQAQRLWEDAGQGHGRGQRHGKLLRKLDQAVNFFSIKGL